MDVQTMLRTAVILLAITALGGLLMAGLRFSGRPNPPNAVAMLHGLLAASGLTLVLYVAFTAGPAGWRLDRPGPAAGSGARRAGAEPALPLGTGGAAHLAGAGACGRGRRGPGDAGDRGVEQRRRLKNKKPAKAVFHWGLGGRASVKPRAGAGPPEGCPSIRHPVLHQSLRPLSAKIECHRRQVSLSGLPRGSLHLSTTPRPQLARESPRAAGGRAMRAVAARQPGAGGRAGPPPAPSPLFPPSRRAVTASSIASCRLELARFPLTTAE
jgi:hypothetical protein